jgi:hypothetical protein
VSDDPTAARTLSPRFPNDPEPIDTAFGSWLFTRASTEIRPIFKDGKAVDHTRQITLGPELDLLLELIGQETDPAKRIGATMMLGALILKGA